MSTTETSIRDCLHFIGGEWVEPGDGGRFDDTDPFTGDVVAHVAAGTRDDARAAVEAAAAAFPEWSRTPPAVRQAIFLKAADVLESRRDEVVEWLARETGCTFGFGMFQMMFVPGLFRQVLDDFRASYVLSYTPRGVTSKGWHEVVVHTRNSRHTVRARKGYDGS